MDNEAIKAIVEEMAPLLEERAPGKLFQLSLLSLAIDFRLRDHRYLFISVVPALPRIHLIERRVRDLEKQSVALTSFALKLKKELADTRVQSVMKDPGDRIVRFCFSGKDASGQPRERTLVAQLTGRAANLFLLNERNQIIARLRPARGTGQNTGEEYRAPASINASGRTQNRGDLFALIQSGRFPSPSKAADFYYESLAARQAFNVKASAARTNLRKRISRHEKLLERLKKDLATHADAERHKRLGDLLLANLTTAKRTRNRVHLIDYFTEGAPEIEIEVDKKLTLEQEAARQFALYSRSKRAVQQISSRIEVVKSELAELYAQRERLEKLIADGDEAALSMLAVSAGLSVPPASAGGSAKKFPGTRRYLSSEGFEILVGRAARDNDFLTFKVARANDLWLHTADYSGSHVVVRNPGRKEVPHRTIIEAAQLAAYFSQARKDQKVDVHYTPRKFLSKPRGAAPGLVRMSRFKTIVVEPQESIKRA